MDVVLDRNAFNTFWIVWFGLVVYAVYEWRDMFELQRPPKTTCDQHPGTESCVHRNKKYNERRKK